MAKQTKKQIKAQLINEVRGQYIGEIGRLKGQIEHLSELFDIERKRNRELREKVARAEEIEEENRKLREWVDRLQDFCNMPQDQFKAEMEKMKAEQDLLLHLDRLTKYTSMLFH